MADLGRSPRGNTLGFNCSSQLKLLALHSVFLQPIAHINSRPFTSPWSKPTPPSPVWAWLLGLSWAFFILPYASAMPASYDHHCGPSEPVLLEGRAEASSLAFMIIPGGWIPGPALRGNPVIIVGWLLFLRKYNQAF